MTFHGPLNFLELEYPGQNCQDPDRCLGLETTQFAVAETCFEFVNSSNLATESRSLVLESIQVQGIKPDSDCLPGFQNDWVAYEEYHSIYLIFILVLLFNNAIPRWAGITQGFYRVDKRRGGRQRNEGLRKLLEWKRD